MLYDRFRNQVFNHYMRGEYLRALELLDQHTAEYPENIARLLYWRACIEGLLKRPEDALKTLSTMVKLGKWFDPEFLRGDPDLSLLLGNPAYEGILAAFGELQAEARRLAGPRLIVLQPPASTPTPYPLAMAIHGRNDNARDFAPYWRGLAESGWLVALPQSSLILGSDSFGWDDNDRAQTELVQLFDRLNNDFAVDDTRILLAGFSQGGGLSLWLTLTQSIAATGFLAIAPYLHGLEAMDIPSAPGAARARGVMITGDQDRGQAMFAEFETRLNAAGASLQRRRYPELAHEVPPDFSTVIHESLEYIYA